MAFWLCPQRDGQDTTWIQRFDPQFWTVDFPRPMAAAVTTTAPDALRVDVNFLTQGDLAGLIWQSADTLDHPLLAFATNVDYTGTTLSFNWQSGGIIALDAVNGPTLTIEGTDASGNAHVWYVRLWNYAQGSPTDAVITLPFSALVGGWAVSGGDPVWPGAIDRMFISLVGPNYVAGSTTALATPVDGWATMSAIACTGDRAMLLIGDVLVPAHGLAAATDYDDLGTQTPARLIRNIRQLGYRGSVLHYIGMSHHFSRMASGGGYVVATGGAVLNTPATAWHQNFFAQCAAAGLSPITSMSFEVLAQYCPSGWGQTAANGDPALTGWVPPSTLLSPANPTAMGWLQSIARAFVAMMVTTGVPIRFQIGEPWWWIMTDGRICLYDTAAQAALGGNPVAIPDMRAVLNAAQHALLDAAGVLLATATAGIVSAARAQAGSVPAEVLLLTYLPTVLDPTMPDAMRANLPVGWASPAFDRLQIEDYDWLTSGAEAVREAAYATVNTRLGYAPGSQDYLAGYVATPSLSDQWRAIDAGADDAVTRSAHEVFVWAMPQICRDGYTRIPAIGDTSDMQAFDEVYYPLALGLDTKVAPEFSTSVIVTASGYERRNSLWSNALLRFDIGPGVRSEDDIGTLIEFFRARRGAARGFLLTDPTDFSSRGMTGVPSATDQILGVGDGSTAQFALVKAYGAAGATGDAMQSRPITRPQADSVLIAVNGTALTSWWSLAPGGIITFATAPASGATVTAGFRFDVPVRFEQDQLQINGATFAAGEAPSVPVVEIREAS